MSIKKIMVLAGGSDQADLIEVLRDKFPACEIILIDMASNVVASKFADRHLVVSTMDFNAVRNVAIEER